MDKDTEILTHESFGQISFSRINGRTKFYGSELEQDNYIQLKVHNSEMERSLTSERYFNTNLILKLRLSAAQFSELITSMNMGTGIPCTIERIEERKIDQLPDIENKKEFVHRKFKDRMVDFATTIKDKQIKALELIKKKTLSNDDQRMLRFFIESLSQEVSSNIPFFAECFQETTDKVVHEAKIEIENAILHKITTLGLNALHEQNKLLSDE